MPTQPRIIKLHPRSKTKLLRLKKEAEESGEYRVAKRIHAVLLNHETNSSPSIAKLLNAPRSKVSLWLKNYEMYGYDSLLEGYRSGRPGELSEKDKMKLAGIIDRGPVSYGFTSAVWTSVMLAEVIHDEFNVEFHPGHIRKILSAMNYSMQKPKRVLARANEAEKNQWRRYLYPQIKKKPLS
jgi:transposase